MKILRKKNINDNAVESVKVEPAQADLEPVIDHTTANAIASKEANEEAAEKAIEASGINKVAQEVVDEIQDPKKDTPAPKTPSLKPYTEARKVANRKELGALIRESSEAGRIYKVSRSDEEGFRYIFEEFEKDYPECYFVCHSDNDANNENGYFESEEEAKAFAEANPEICCVIKVCGNEEEKVWEKPLEECDKQTVKEDVDPRPNHTKLLGFIEEGLVDYKTVAEALMSACSDDELGEIIETYDWGYIDESKTNEAFEDRPLRADMKPEEYGEDITEKVKELLAKGFDVTTKVEHRKNSDGQWTTEIEVLNILPDGSKIIGMIKPEAEKYFADNFNSTLIKNAFKLFDEEKKEVKQTNEEKEVCPECGKEPCECEKAEGKESEEKSKEEKLDEVMVAPMSEPGDLVEDDEEDKEQEHEEEIEEPIIDGGLEIIPDDFEAESAEETEAPAASEGETNPEDVEIDIDSIDTFEPTDEVAKTTMTTIKDAGDGAMFAFKDTLKDLYNLKIKVSDLQKLLSSSSDWLLDLLGFNSQPEEPVIHPEEIPTVEAPSEEPTFEDEAPVMDISTIDINGFDDVEPVEYAEEDQKFFVQD